MNPTKTLLRETVEEMTEQALMMDGLAARAMVQGRRMRLRRQLGTGAAVVVVLAAVAVPFALTRGSHQAPAIVATSPTAAAVIYGDVSETRLGVDAGWQVVGGGSLVWDTAQAKLVRVVADGTVLPAPTGDFYAVEKDYVLRFGKVGGSGLVGLPAGSPLYGGMQWSPTSSRALVGIMQKNDGDLPFKVGFAVIDPATGVLTPHWIDPDRYYSSINRFTWSRDGSEVVLPISDKEQRSEAHEVYKELQFFNAETGEPTRVVPLRGVVSGPFSLSPDGRFAIASESELTPKDFMLVDLTTGETRPFPADAAWITDTLLISVDKAGVIQTLRPDGSVVAEYKLTGALRAYGVIVGPQP